MTSYWARREAPCLTILLVEDFSMGAITTSKHLLSLFSRYLPERFGGLVRLSRQFAGDPRIL